MISFNRIFQFWVFKKRVVEIGYILYVFDRRYGQSFTAFHPNKVIFKTDGIVAENINGYALVFTNNLLSTGIDGQKHFDVIYVPSDIYFIHDTIILFQC